MTYADRVRGARNPHEAILVVAAGIDDILSKLTAQSNDSGWGEWAPSSAETSSVPTDDEVRGWIATHYTSGDPADVTPDIIAQVRHDILESRKPQAAPEPDLFDVQGFGSGVVVDFKPPSEEVAATRRHFATYVLKLNEAYGPAPAGVPDWIESYVKGGPMWLYQADRDLVLALPVEVKSKMIEDVQAVSNRAAHELSSDILKMRDPDEAVNLDGSGMKIGEGNVG